MARAIEAFTWGVNMSRIRRRGVFRFGLNRLVGVIDNYSNLDGLKALIDTTSLYDLELEVSYLTNIRCDVQPPRLSDTDEVTLSCNGFTLALTLTGRH